MEVLEYQSDEEGSGGLMTMKVTPKVTLSKYPSMHSVDGILADLDIGQTQKMVAFPEFGVDLIGKQTEKKSFENMP